MHPARSPVPRLDGQVRIQPRCSECMKSCPSFLRTSWIFWVELANRVMIRLMLSPEIFVNAFGFFSLKKTFLHWDDAHLILLVDPDEKILLVVVKDSYIKFNRMINFHLGLIFLPRASGQWRPHPDDRRRVESGSWNRFPAVLSCSSFSTLIPLGLGS